MLYHHSFNLLIMLVPSSTIPMPNAKRVTTMPKSEIKRLVVEGERIGDDSLYLTGVIVSGGRIKFIRGSFYI